MKQFVLAFSIILVSMLAQAECPGVVKGMEKETELARIEAGSDFSKCSTQELEQLQERFSKLINLFCAV